MFLWFLSINKRHIFHIHQELYWKMYRTVCSAVVQSLSHVRLFATPWTAACQAPLSFTLLEFVQVYVHWVSDAIQHLILCCPLLLLLSILPRISIFSNESACSATFCHFPGNFIIPSSQDLLSFWANSCSRCLFFFLVFQGFGNFSIMRSFKRQKQIEIQRCNVWWIEWMNQNFPATL